MNKLCVKCGKEKPLTEYHKGDGRHGTQTYCKPCVRKYQAVWRDRNRAQIQSKDRERWKKRRDGNLMRKYGIGIDDYDRMFSDQGGVCAICESSESGSNGWGRYENLHVDHDHKTGLVRGLLCFNCNTGIGQFKSDPAILQRAAIYITP